jgi:hypothetical protein
MVIEMLYPTDFFQEQVQQCKTFAAQSSNKNDRNFWHRMADRWEGLLQARQQTIGGVERFEKTRFDRRIFAKRRRAA